jgi:hypothetical protein
MPQMSWAEVALIKPTILLHMGCLYTMLNYAKGVVDSAGSTGVSKTVLYIADSAICDWPWAAVELRW